MGDHQHQAQAMGDHQPQIAGPQVTLQQTQVQIAGLPVPDAMALVPAQVHAVASESPEKAALRSEVAYLQNLIQQQQSYAETVWTEQRTTLSQEAEAALQSQREGFMNASAKYESEARDVAAVESAQAVNKAESSLHASFRHRMLKAEGDLSRYEQNEANIIAQHVKALQESQNEIQAMNATLQQSQMGLAVAHDANANAAAEYQQLKAIQLEAEQRANEKSSAAASEMARAEKLLASLND